MNLDDLNAAGVQLRAAAGIRPGVELTNEQLRLHAGLLADELERRGVDAGARHWWTAQRHDGRICGRWAHSWAEAVLELAPVAWCVVDDGLEAHGAYYPFGRHAGDREAWPVTDRPLSRAELVMAETPAGALF